MADHVLLVEQPADWRDDWPALPVVSARDYLASVDYSSKRRLHVINLCRGYRYLTVGYYCSLLAEARGHKVLPTVRTVQDLTRRGIYSVTAENLDDMVQKALGKQPQPPQSPTYEIMVFFGRCEASEFRDIARLAFEAFRCPILKLEFRLQGSWRIHEIKSLPLAGLPPSAVPGFLAGLDAYLSRRWRKPRAPRAFKYDMAVLRDPAETLPPSDSRALRRLEKVARTRGINVELIERQDFGKLAEYDALFIRETTRIDHHTYRFATRAEREGMVVIDDPESILKCANKIYLAELLHAHRVPTPKSMVLRKETLLDVEAAIAYPIVLKIPDGAFSLGVFRVHDRNELQQVAQKLFRDSELILAQEFLYTKFDWRIGILDRKPLYACHYYMSRKHWQIVEHGTDGKPREGDAKTFDLAKVPPQVVDVAMRAANLIGDGLYGVDLKETDNGIVVIEVNDNPSIESGVEDAVLGDALYEAIVGVFLERLERRGEVMPARQPAPREASAGGDPGD